MKKQQQRPAIILGPVQLKKVDTRVRHRDGTVFCERRGDGGEYVHEKIGVADPPSYLKEQEEGFSTLTPKFFDEATGRWVPLDPAVLTYTPTSLPQPDTSTVASVSVVSYNVWFSERNQEARAYELFKIISGADVVFLQEVTSQFLAWLCAEPWCAKTK